MTTPQDTLDALDIGVVRFDRHLRLVSWNRPLFVMLEYPRHMAGIGTSFLSFVDYNIARGEHGRASRDNIIRQRLARRFACYSRVRPDGSLLNVRSRRMGDGGFLKTFTLSSPTPAPAPLSKREQEVLQWAAQGKTAAETAIILGVTERTVEFHVGNAVVRLQAVNKVHAVALALSEGLIPKTL